MLFEVFLNHILYSDCFLPFKCFFFFEIWIIQSFFKIFCYRFKNLSYGHFLRAFFSEVIIKSFTGSASISQKIFVSSTIQFLLSIHKAFSHLLTFQHERKIEQFPRPRFRFCVFKQFLLDFADYIFFFLEMGKNINR